MSSKTGGRGITGWSYCFCGPDGDFFPFPRGGCLPTADVDEKFRINGHLAGILHGGRVPRQELNVSEKMRLIEWKVVADCRPAFYNRKAKAYIDSSESTIFE